MSRLINPGTGDLVDRLTILSLKILYGKAAGRLVDHFENERNAILVQVRAKNNFPSWYEQALALHAVNSALWQEEDTLRHFRAQTSPKDLPDAHESVLAGIAECAFRIQDLNDQRSQLIAEINSKTGDNLGPEKLT